LRFLLCHSTRLRGPRSELHRRTAGTTLCVCVRAAGARKSSSLLTLTLQFHSYEYLASRFGCKEVSATAEDLCGMWPRSSTLCRARVSHQYPCR
jgi:hypothetical protein